MYIPEELIWAFVAVAMAPSIDRFWENMRKKVKKSVRSWLND